MAAEDIGMDEVVFGKQWQVLTKCIEEGIWSNSQSEAFLRLLLFSRHTSHWIEMAVVNT